MTDKPNPSGSHDNIDEGLEYLRDFNPRHVGEVPKDTPFCIYITRTEFGPTGGLVPSVVYENVSGHFPLTGNGNNASPWEWGDYATAAKLAAEYNTRLGLTEERAREIVASSFRQHFTQDAKGE